LISPTNDTFADHRLEGIDGASLGQRIDVDRLDPFRGRIAEQLGDAGARGRARHGDVDISGEARRLDGALAIAQQQGAHASFPRRKIWKCRGAADRRRGQDDRGGERDDEGGAGGGNPGPS
jgi:hypothetical protein